MTSFSGVFEKEKSEAPADSDCSMHNNTARKKHFPNDIIFPKPLTFITIVEIDTDFHRPEQNCRPERLQDLLDSALDLRV